MIQIVNHLWERLAMHAPGTRHSDRFLLWIDAVGGYWVCLGNEIVLGQPGRQPAVDVPILGDIAGCHARLRAMARAFLWKPYAKFLSMAGRCVRRSGCATAARFNWASVRLLFRRPHALSGTVRLEFLSRHRTQPLADAVLWMADSCVLGPKPHSHVVCRNWPREVILYRDGDELWCCTGDTLQIDGVLRTGRGQITEDSRIQGDGFSFNLEGPPV